MLLYGKMLKLTELRHFLTDFGSVQKWFWLYIKFEPNLLDQTIPNFEFSRQNKLLTRGEKDNSILHHFVQKMTKTWQELYSK